MGNKRMLRYAHTSLLSNREILNFTRKESIDNYRETEKGNNIVRYELLMLNIIVGRFKHHEHLNNEDYKKMEYLIWSFC